MKSKDGAKEWVTVKIPKYVRDDAQDDPRTYEEIMLDGLEKREVEATDMTIVFDEVVTVEGADGEE